MSLKIGGPYFLRRNMITEFKLAEKSGKYLLNILVEVGSADVKVFAVGVENEDGQYDILEGGDEVIAQFKLAKITEDPAVVREAFHSYVEKNGFASLEAAILREPAPFIEEVVEKKPVAKKAPAKKKPTAKKD